MKKGDLWADFLFTCKDCYFEKIAPANPEVYSHPKYLALVNIAKEFFRDDLYEEFAGSLEESQYYVALWVAHLLLEHGDPNIIIKIKALNTILEYLDNPVFDEVLEQEDLWLKKVEISIRT